MLRIGVARANRTGDCVIDDVMGDDPWQSAKTYGITPLRRQSNQPPTAATSNGPAPRSIV